MVRARYCITEVVRIIKSSLFSFIFCVRWAYFSGGTGGLTNIHSAKDTWHCLPLEKQGCLIQEMGTKVVTARSRDAFSGAKHSKCTQALLSSETHFKYAGKPICLTYLTFLLAHGLWFIYPKDNSIKCDLLPQGWSVHCQGARLLYHFSIPLCISLSSSKDLAKRQILVQ